MTSAPVPPHDPWTATTDHVDLAPLIVDQARVAAQAAAMSGIDAESLTFAGLEPISPAAVVCWNSIVAHARRVLLDPEAAAVPLVQSETVRLLTTGLLATFPNTGTIALDDLPRARTQEAEPAIPATLRPLSRRDPATVRTPVRRWEARSAARCARTGFAHPGRVMCRMDGRGQRWWPWNAPGLGSGGDEVSGAA